MSRSGSFQAPPGFRDSPGRALAAGEVVASTYAVRAELARTETGTVFEARDMMLDRYVALKLAWRDPGTPSLILEARRCAQVRSPCSVAIYGMGNHHGVEYVIGERVAGALLRELIEPPLAPDAYLARLRTLFAAVAQAHEAGVAVGEISGSTILVADERVVLGRLSLSQVPAFGSLGQILAPEIARGETAPTDPAAAEAIDLYGLGCVAIEMARGAPPFAAEDRDAELRGHAFDPPPRLADIRPDLPIELSDLIEWLLQKVPADRPRSVRDARAQLDVISERVGAKGRSLRVLVVVDDPARSRWLWSLARRAHASAIVELATEGTDAAHKLNRDQPDLVFVDAALSGAMNALELCMYARGIEAEAPPQLVLIGSVADADRALFAGADVPLIAETPAAAPDVIEWVRRVAALEPKRRKPRTISG